MPLKAGSKTIATDDQASEIRRLKQELARVTEERGTLKIDEACRMRISLERQSEVSVYQSTLSALQVQDHVPHVSRPSE